MITAIICIIIIGIFVSGGIKWYRDEQRADLYVPKFGDAYYDGYGD